MERDGEGEGEGGGGGSGPSKLPFSSNHHSDCFPRRPRGKTKLLSLLVDSSSPGFFSCVCTLSKQNKIL